MRIKEATAIAGTLGYPSKMPGTSYGISAHACLTGAKLAKIPGSTCHNCYALKGNYVYATVKKSHQRRLEGLAHPAWSIAMATLLKSTHGKARGPKGPIKAGWHRWHDSGDLQSVEHLTKICAVAAMTPEIRHWLPTRELGIVTRYKAQGGIVPDNLTIRVSATMVDGPATKAWPQVSTVHSFVPHFSPLNDAPHPNATHICPAPKQDNNCGSCRACWSLDIANVSYHKH